MTKTICHIIIAFGNKNQSYTKVLLELLNERSKFEHFVFCNRYFTPTNKIKVKTIKDTHWITFFVNHIKKYGKDLHYRKLTRAIGFKELKKKMALLNKVPNIVHIHHVHAVSIPMLTYFKNKSVKIIITLRGRDLLIDTNNAENRKLLLDKLGFADQIHSISNYMQNYLKDLSGFDSKVIYRGQELPVEKNVKQEVLPMEEIRIISVGRLEWVKGHIYIIESVARLIAKGHNIYLDIYGDGSLKEFLAHRIEQLNLQKYITLKGHVDITELRMVYKTYALGVQVSLSEALSNGLIDLMMHNLPCLISNVGGMPEIISNHKNGIVVDINDMTKLDEAILDGLALDFESLVDFNNTHKLKFTRTKEIEGLNELYTHI